MKLKQRPRIRLKIKLIPLFISTIAVIVFAAVMVSDIITAPPAAHAGGSVSYPNLSFHDPVLISGSAGQVGAVYLFTEVHAGIDAQIEILDLFNGARLDDMDHFTAGYYAAWQPFVAAPGGTDNASWIDWRITFKIAGTEIDTNVTNLAATAVDVDGDGAYLKELVEGDHVLSYSMLPNSMLTITFNHDSCQATSTFANVANIDTNRFEAMFMMAFKNVSTIDYRTGAISNYGAEEVRQNCIYFRYFDAMPAPTPLPIELISFNAKSDQTKIALQWSTASEVNNDYFTVERSVDAKNFEKILTMKGAGNSHSVINYSAVDNYPLIGTSYYRLKQTDFNGQFAYSDVKAVSKNDIEKEAAFLEIKSVAPSVFRDNFKINFISEVSGEVDFVLASNTGQLMRREKINAQQGLNSYQYYDEHNLPAGAYFVVLAFNDKKVSYKVIKQ